MKLRDFLMLLAFIFLVSCGSKKQLVEKSSQKNSINQRKSKVTTVTPKIDDKTEKDLKETIVLEKEEFEEEIKEVKIVSTNIDHTQQYINLYKDIAILEMHKYKIPASITLAQGVLESGSGRSELALKSNNHFGIKCHKGWKGHSVSHDDDAKGECFRKYKHPKTSYEDHSKFLTTRSRYSKLFKLKLTDYSGWAYGLKQAGYATDPRYPRKLIAIIKKYNLHGYDTVGLKDTNIKDQNIASSSGLLVKSYTIAKGDTLYSLSRRYNTTVKKLKELNGLTDNTLSIGQELLVP